MKKEKMLLLLTVCFLSLVVIGNAELVPESVSESGYGLTPPPQYSGPLPMPNQGHPDTMYPGPGNIPRTPPGVAPDNPQVPPPNKPDYPFQDGWKGSPDYNKPPLNPDLPPGSTAPRSGSAY